jgi:hypothetical protein
VTHIKKKHQRVAIEDLRSYLIQQNIQIS